MQNKLNDLMQSKNISIKNLEVNSELKTEEIINNKDLVI